MAEQQQIQQTLRACLHHTTIQQGEAMLSQLSKSPTFLESLLALIFAGIKE